MHLSELPHGYIVLHDPHGPANAAHIYKMLGDRPWRPMCRHGWNRSGGRHFFGLPTDIHSARVCAACSKNLERGMPPFARRGAEGPVRVPKRREDDE